MEHETEAVLNEIVECKKIGCTLFWHLCHVQRNVCEAPAVKASKEQK